jgi:hypothetical protein
VISRLFAGVYGQGTRTVLNRQTSFGTFGGGDANICMPCINICGTSGGNTTPAAAGALPSAWGGEYRRQPSQQPMTLPRM